MRTNSVYAPFGTVQFPPDRPEPTPKERAAALRADQVGHFDLIRERKWSEDDTAMAARSGLLPPNGDCGGARLILGSDGLPRGRQVFYSRTWLAEREAALKTFVQRLK